MENFIRSYNAPSNVKCTEVIQWFEDNHRHAAEGRISGGVNKKIKESLDISISLKNGSQIPCMVNLLNFLWDGVKKYSEEFPIIKEADFGLIEDFNIQKYTPPAGGYKSTHFENESLRTCKRFLTWMIYLNTVEDEGETEFVYLGLKEKAVEGKLLIWPPSFTHAHRGVISKTEKKYIMTGWYSLIEPEIFID